MLIWFVSVPLCISQLPVTLLLKISRTRMGEEYDTILVLVLFVVQLIPELRWRLLMTGASALHRLWPVLPAPVHCEGSEAPHEEV